MTATPPLPRRLRHTRAASTRSAVARLLLLAAFLIQSTFVQAHVHAAPPATSAALSVSQDAGPAGDASKHEPAGTSSYCFLCWEAAVAGQFIQPAATILPPPPQPDGWVVPRSEQAFALGKHSHGWQSRAPPQ